MIGRRNYEVKVSRASRESAASLVCEGFSRARGGISQPMLPMVRASHIPKGSPGDLDAPRQSVSCKLLCRAVVRVELGQQMPSPDCFSPKSMT